jgi:hypothetical protein
MARQAREQGREAGAAGEWTFLTNHAHVLIYLARQPDATLRVVAEAVGITERAVQRIVAELERAAVLSRRRSGRRNRYEIHAQRPLRHPIESHCTVEDLLKMVAATGMAAAPSSQRARRAPRRRARQ